MAQKRAPIAEVDDHARPSPRPEKQKLTAGESNEAGRKIEI
jgi:hypothetical protein